MHTRAHFHFSLRWDGIKTRKTSLEETTFNLFSLILCQKQLFCVFIFVVYDESTTYHTIFQMCISKQTLEMREFHSQYYSILECLSDIIPCKLFCLFGKKPQMGLLPNHFIYCTELNYFQQIKALMHHQLISYAQLGP